MGSLRNEIGSVRNEMESLRKEMRAEIATVHTEIPRFDNVADLRKRMASLEAKFAQQT